jgi:hypothetical protein
VIAISSCSLVPGTFPTIHISSDPNIVTIDDPTLRCSIAGSTTSFCYYTAPVANGQANNALSTLSYSVGGVVVAGGSGSLGAACGSAAGSFNVLLTHIVEGGTNRTVTITTS